MAFVRKWPCLQSDCSQSVKINPAYLSLRGIDGIAGIWDNSPKRGPNNSPNRGNSIGKNSNISRTSIGRQWTRLGSSTRYRPEGEILHWLLLKRYRDGVEKHSNHKY